MSLGKSWQGFDARPPSPQLQAALINKIFGLYSPRLASDESRCIHKISLFNYSLKEGKKKETNERE